MSVAHFSGYSFGMRVEVKVYLWFYTHSAVTDIKQRRCVWFLAALTGISLKAQSHTPGVNYRKPFRDVA